MSLAIVWSKLELATPKIEKNMAKNLDAPVAISAFWGQEVRNWRVDFGRIFLNFESCELWFQPDDS